jgi:hypothetical protein
MEPGRVVYIKASLGLIARPCLKTKQKNKRTAWTSVEIWEVAHI